MSIVSFLYFPKNDANDAKGHIFGVYTLEKSRKTRFTSINHITFDPLRKLNYTLRKLNYTKVLTSILVLVYNKTRNILIGFLFFSVYSVPPDILDLNQVIKEAGHGLSILF